MIVEWNYRALASVEQQRETYHSARGYTRTKLTPRSWEWSIAGRLCEGHVALRYTQRSKTKASSAAVPGLLIVQ